MSDHCSFCGKSQSQVFRLIKSDGCAICVECVGVCCNIIAEEFKKTARDLTFPQKSEDET